MSLVASVSSIVVVPTWIGSTVVQDHDNKDELYLHVETEHCDTRIQFCVKEGETTDIFNTAISSSGDIKMILEERDTFNNDDSTPVMLKKAYLDEMALYLDWMYETGRSELPAMPMQVHFFFTGDFTSFMEDVPLKDLMCISATDVIPGGGIAAKAAKTTWKLFQAAKKSR